MSVLLPFYYKDFYKKVQFLKVFVWFVLILLLILSLEMSFVSDLFFSKLAKYLLFFSPCSTISAFERSINPCILSSVIFSNALFFPVIFFNRFNFVVI